MSKRARESRAQEEEVVRRPSRDRGIVPVYVTLAGVVLVAVLAVMVRKDVRELGEAVGKLDTQLAQLQTRVDAAARPATPPRRGPDPEKAYAFRLEGAPIRGNPAAPITIVEVSDYQ